MLQVREHDVDLCGEQAQEPLVRCGKRGEMAGLTAGRQGMKLKFFLADLVGVFKIEKPTAVCVD